MHATCCVPQGEVANAAPQVTKFMVELSKQISFAELMKLLKCFPAGTQVVVATELIDGRWRYRTVAIETLNAGDLVLAREEYGPQVKLQRIEETFVRVSDHLRILEFRDASGGTQTIKTTDEHPFWSHDRARYVLASELNLGAQVVGPNEEIQTLIASNREEFGRGILVYNFRVAEYNTYYVSEAVDATPLLVHNAKYAKGKTHEHHSDPKFMGGDPKQSLTDIPVPRHQRLHKDLNHFLRGKTDAAGNHMRPQPGNSGAKIRGNFTREERLDALAQFYKRNRSKYRDAARDFFKQHPHLK